MGTEQVYKRIKELKDLIRAQQKYNDFFCGNVIESRELQSELSFLQKPTITAINNQKQIIEKIEQPIEKIEDIIIEKTDEEEEIDDNFKKVKEILNIKETIPFIPDNLKINHTSLTPLLGISTQQKVLYGSYENECSIFYNIVVKCM